MNTFLNVAALGLAGMMALSSGVVAGGLYDGDDDNRYNRESQSSYCYKHPYDDTCQPHAQRYDDQRHYGYSNGSGRCTALVRAVGKRNLLLGFARNSARFAWVREARFVHGDQYADWNNARDVEIACTRVGALSSCEAIARPCR